MSYKASNICCDRLLGSPSRKQIMMFFADKASDDGSGIYCSKGYVARHTELGRSTVRRIVSEFVQEGFLIETGSRKCMNGYTVIYRIDLETVALLPSVNDDEDEDDTPLLADRVLSERGTGPEVGVVPLSERDPNHPKTIHKPPTRANRMGPEFDEDLLEAILANYPSDRLRDKATCMSGIAAAIREGLHPDDLLCAVKAYAEDTKGYTRSKVSFSDNWFKAQRWKRGLDEIEVRRVKVEAAGLIVLKQAAAWIIEAHSMCRHISRDQLEKVLAAGLVTREQSRAAGFDV